MKFHQIIFLFFRFTSIRIVQCLRSSSYVNIRFIVSIRDALFWKNVIMTEYCNDVWSIFSSLLHVILHFVHSHLNQLFGCSDPFDCSLCLQLITILYNSHIAHMDFAITTCFLCSVRPGFLCWAEIEVFNPNLCCC